MLKGINPLLTGELLLHLDRLGHSDLVVIADAHFPAHRLGATVLDIPVTSPSLARAVCGVIELDDSDPVRLMDSGTGRTDVQLELIDAVGLPESLISALGRFEFYDLAATASLIVRTAETRIYANLILAKGVTPSLPGHEVHSQGASI